MVFEKKAAFGHMIPSYQIEKEYIDQEIFEKAIQATPNLQAVYINKKTLKKSQVSEYKQWFHNRGIPPISSKELTPLA